MTGLTLLAAGTANADLFSRGDANCSVDLSAADITAAARAVGGNESCDNADCNRDGTVSADDVECSALCLFGECAIPANAPGATRVTPEIGSILAPFSTVRITAVRLQPGTRLTEVLIGGVLAEVVEIVSATEVLVVVPPLPPGPAAVVIRSGELSGVASTIDIVAPVPVGEPDTLDGTLALLSTVLERFAELDLESVYGDDAAVVRLALQAYREEIAEQRIALVNDPALTAEIRAQLDLAFDSSQVADALRSLLDEIDTLLASEAAVADVDGAAQTVQVAIAARRLARTVAVARGVAALGGGIASVPVSALVVGGTILTGALTLAGSAALPPVMVSFFFTDRAGERTSQIVADGGTITVRGARLLGADLVVRTAIGDLLQLQPESSGDDFRTFRLFHTYGFCGTAEFYLKRSLPLLGESQHVVRVVRPELRSFYGTTEVRVGDTFTLDSRSVAGCQSYARFYGPNAGQFNFTVSPLKARDSNSVATVVPSLPTDPYGVEILVNFATTDILNGVQVFNPLNTVIVRCGALQLQVPPELPSQTVCSASLLPVGATAPAGSRFIWASSDPGTAIIDGGGAQVKVIAQHPGTTEITAVVKLGDRELAGPSDPVTKIEVDDHFSPAVTLSTSSPSTVAPGAAIPMRIRALDNDFVTRIVLRATGDAVLNPAQEFPCIQLESTCVADFNVNLKESDFSNQQVTVEADAFDGSGNQGTSRALTFTIEAPPDTQCPVLSIGSPADGGTVNAGETVAVVANAADNRSFDTGVKRFRYTATGDALVAAVSQELPLPMALPTSDLRFSFTVKDAAALRDVTNRTITITAEAVDDAGNSCPQTWTVSVIGTLDNCQGSIVTDNSSGYIDEPFTITVTITGAVAEAITSVTSINPGGTFDLTPRGNGVYQVTLFYQGRGSFTLRFIASDADGNERCTGSIGLTALGPAPEAAAASFDDGPPGGRLNPPAH